MTFYVRFVAFIICTDKAEIWIHFRIPYLGMEIFSVLGIVNQCCSLLEAHGTTASPGCDCDLSRKLLLLIVICGIHFTEKCERRKSNFRDLDQNQKLLIVLVNLCVWPLQAVNPEIWLLCCSQIVFVSKALELTTKCVDFERESLAINSNSLANYRLLASFRKA